LQCILLIDPFEYMIAIRSERAHGHAHDIDIVCVAVDLPDVEGMDRGTANEWLRQRRAEFMAQ
jgi:hypothetical protein